ncbi:hypothetical protein EV193_101990 [Herbihabitans rhizosphaerae]|uniref:DUF3558 domain-containing protein n=1 Tax=Herbihabitans rhizosphaerae TaxID=1872711 RepID=A0A4V2EUM6_9PSEU|nr:hypothetical protein [Herbihabitans rhizosphaerae]RZS45103.1 hypothetical protein EV193_101990 [Herbihabitans rhizosphaerae]
MRPRPGLAALTAAALIVAGCGVTVIGSASPDPAATTTTPSPPATLRPTPQPVNPPPFTDACPLLPRATVGPLLGWPLDAEQDMPGNPSPNSVVKSCAYRVGTNNVAVMSVVHYPSRTASVLIRQVVQGQRDIEQVPDVGEGAVFFQDVSDGTFGMRAVKQRGPDALMVHVRYVPPGGQQPNKAALGNAVTAVLLKIP